MSSQTLASYLLASLFAIGGSLALVAALFNLGWFFASQNSRIVSGSMRRSLARLLYGVVGVCVLALSAYLFITA